MLAQAIEMLTVSLQAQILTVAQLGYRSSDPGFVPSLPGMIA